MPAAHWAACCRRLAGRTDAPALLNLSPPSDGGVLRATLLANSKCLSPFPAGRMPAAHWTACCRRLAGRPNAPALLNLSPPSDGGVLRATLLANSKCLSPFPAGRMPAAHWAACCRRLAGRTNAPALLNLSPPSDGGVLRATLLAIRNAFLRSLPAGCRQHIGRRASVWSASSLPALSRKTQRSNACGRCLLDWRRATFTESGSKLRALQTLARGLDGHRKSHQAQRNVDTLRPRTITFPSCNNRRTHSLTRSNSCPACKQP